MMNSAHGKETCRRMGDTTRSSPVFGETDSIKKAHVYQLRVGPNYKKHKRKGPCATSLYDVVSCDIFHSKKKIINVARYFQLPSLPPGRGKVNGVPPYLIINVLFPMYSISMFGSKKDDGETFQFVAYFLMKQETQERLAEDVINDQPPAYRLLRDFIQQDDMKDRFKAVAGLMNPSEAGLSSAIASLVRAYNFKPLLTRPQHHWSTDDETYIECAVDVHDFNYLTRSTWATLRSSVSKMVIEAGFTIEGRSDDELPELLLGNDVFRNADIETAPHIDFDKEPFVTQKPSNFFIHEVVPHLYPPPPEKPLVEGIEPDDQLTTTVKAANAFSEILVEDGDALAVSDGTDSRVSVETVKTPDMLDTTSEGSVFMSNRHNHHPDGDDDDHHQEQHPDAGPPASTHVSSDVTVKSDVDISSRKARRARRRSRRTSVAASPTRDTPPQPARPKVKVEDTIHLPLSEADRLINYLVSRTTFNPGYPSDNVSSSHQDAADSSEDEFFDCVSDPSLL
eukprot:m.256710 g.256710  ORF g.256710 m.256710 type:complete len:509 (-) comp22383_c0_seq1:503-2029(-)